MTSENADNSIKGNDTTAHSESKTPEHPKETESAPPPITTQPDTKPHCKHHEITCNAKRDWIDWLTLGLEGFGLLVVIIYTATTIVYAVITHRQWEAMRCANALTDSNYRNDQRAWMGFSLPEGAQYRDKETRNGTQVSKQPIDILVPMEIVNTGKTPAFKVNGNIVITVIEKGEKLDVGTYGKGHATYVVNGGVMFPGGKMGLAQHAIKHGPTKAIVIVPTQALRKRIEDENAFIVVHGRIDYDDIRKRHHFTTFCRYVSTPGLIDHECMDFNAVDEDESNNHPLSGCPVPEPN